MRTEAYMEDVITRRLRELAVVHGWQRVNPYTAPHLAAHGPPRGGTADGLGQLWPGGTDADATRPATGSYLPGVRASPVRSVREAVRARGHCVPAEHDLRVVDVAERLTTAAVFSRDVGSAYS
jgi:hypothetical protein